MAILQLIRSLLRMAAQETDNPFAAFCAACAAVLVDMIDSLLVGPLKHFDWLTMMLLLISSVCCCF